jgi:16S rRNA (guanine966-N2)-methyltransferase
MPGDPGTPGTRCRAGWWTSGRARDEDHRRRLGRPSDLQAPPGRATRPTTDRVREAWMSIVAPALPGARVLDLFAGSGALGLEALSRGATTRRLRGAAPRGAPGAAREPGRARRGPRAEDRALRRPPLRRGLEAGAFDLAFADPPYGTGLAAALAERFAERPFATAALHRARRRTTSPGAPRRPRPALRRHRAHLSLPPPNERRAHRDLPRLLRPDHPRPRGHHPAQLRFADRVIVAVAHRATQAKTGLFTVEERVEMIRRRLRRRAAGGGGRLQGLLVDFARERGAR